MIYHPIINQLANLDMAFLVKPADEQHIANQTACFCPFCQKKADDGMDDSDTPAQQTPHFIIYNNDVEVKQEGNFGLSNVAATVVELLGYQPDEVWNESIIK